MLGPIIDRSQQQGRRSHLANSLAAVWTYEPDVAVVDGELVDDALFVACCCFALVLVVIRGEGVAAHVTALHAGAADVLTAPIDRDEVLARVVALLRRRPGVTTPVGLTPTEGRLYESSLATSAGCCLVRPSSRPCGRSLTATLGCSTCTSPVCGASSVEGKARSPPCGESGYRFTRSPR